MTMIKILMAALVVILANGCRAPVQPAFSQSAEPREAVLIVTEKSAFKQAVVNRVTARLKTAQRSYRVADLAALSGTWPEDHKAVVIVNEVQAWRLRGDVRRFLKRITPGQRGRIVLVSTAADADWQAKEPGIDAVTAASIVANEQKTADFILRRIDAILTGTTGQATAAPGPWP
jgi:hypothetical protein